VRDGGRGRRWERASSCSEGERGADQGSCVGTREAARREEERAEGREEERGSEWEAKRVSEIP
jgi:hypothetical protein